MKVVVYGKKYDDEIVDWGRKGRGEENTGNKRGGR